MNLQWLKRQLKQRLKFKGYENVKAGIVKWPMSVIRIASEDKLELVELADKILTAWRGYTDENSFIYAETHGEKAQHHHPNCKNERRQISSLT